MTKTSSKRKTTTTVKGEGKPIKATPVRRRKAVIAAPAVVEVPVTEATVVEAPKAEAQVFSIPDLGVSDLVMSREGHHQLPGKTWYRLTGRFGKQAIRQAIAAMVGLDLRLEAAMELVTWPAFRPYMVGQLAAVKANPDVKIVLEWVWAHQDFTWQEAYTAFPRVGIPGGKATKREIGKLNKLVGLMDGLRKEGKTSVHGVDLLAQAAHLLGWIK